MEKRLDLQGRIIRRFRALRGTVHAYNLHLFFLDMRTHKVPQGYCPVTVAAIFPPYDGWRM